MVTDATIPAGIRLEVTVARDISPYADRGVYTGSNGGGGDVQFRVVDTVPRDVFPTWFTNPRPLP
jgi:filamentous hemagglutinin